MRHLLRHTLEPRYSPELVVSMLYPALLTGETLVRGFESECNPFEPQARVLNLRKITTPLLQPVRTTTRSIASLTAPYASYYSRQTINFTPTAKHFTPEKQFYFFNVHS
jgi:hypothetical protein